MSNRTTLYILMILAAAAIGLRMWSVSSLEGWEEAQVTHVRLHKNISETCTDLEGRREDAPKGTDRASFRKHFQSQAYAAQMGGIDVKVINSSPKRTHVDKRFEIDFDGKEQGFSRASLRLFLFKSEQLYPRVRATELHLRPIGGSGRSRGIDPGVEREDIWEVTKMEFRQRSPTAGGQ